MTDKVENPKEEQEREKCEAFFLTKHKIAEVLKSFGERQVNLQSEAARSEVAEEMMIVIAEQNRDVFADYITNLRRVIAEELVDPRFEEERRLILSDALWLEDKGIKFEVLESASSLPSVAISEATPDE